MQHGPVRVATARRGPELDGRDDARRPNADRLGEGHARLLIKTGPANPTPRVSTEIANKGTDSPNKGSDTQGHVPLHSLVTRIKLPSRMCRFNSGSAHAPSCPRGCQWSPVSAAECDPQSDSRRSVPASVCDRSSTERKHAIAACIPGLEQTSSCGRRQLPVIFSVRQDPKNRIPSGISSTGPQAAFQDRPVTGPPASGPLALGWAPPGTGKLKLRPRAGAQKTLASWHGAGSESWAAGRGAHAP